MGSIGQFVYILQTEVHLTDDIPSVFQRVGKLVVRSRIQVAAATVQIGLVVVLPVTVVAQVDFCCQVTVAAAGVHDFILTPVEGAAPEV